MSEPVSAEYYVRNSSDCPFPAEPLQCLFEVEQSCHRVPHSDDNAYLLPTGLLSWTTD